MNISNAIDTASTVQALQEYTQEPVMPNDKIWLQLVVEDGRTTLKAVRKSEMTLCQTIMNFCRVDVFDFKGVIAFLEERKTLLESQPIAKRKFELATEHYNSKWWFQKSTVPVVQEIVQGDSTETVEDNSQPIQNEPTVIDVTNEEPSQLPQYADGWLANLKELSQDTTDPHMLGYLYGELQGLDKLAVCHEPIKEEVFTFRKDLQEKINSGIFASNGNESALSVSFFESSILGVSSIIKVPGIQNVGNSCYMSSALQGLFVSPVVTKAIDTCVPKKGEERFIQELKSFLNNYRIHRENLQGNLYSIGQYASRLHFELYEAKLKPYINDLYDMADADLIAMVLGEALGLEYELITRRIATKTDTSLGSIIHDVPTKQFVWPEIKTDGIGEASSLQEVFNQHCACLQEEHNLGWNYITGNGVPITINDARIGYRLKGTPPPLLVFKVGTSEGERMDTTFTPYSVTERDAIFDVSCAFDSRPESGTKYRLISVLQNHDRRHWTAMARYQNRWYNCDDSFVNKLGSNTPNTTAAVMIYERM